MGKEIITTPDAIRTAGNNISGLSTKSSYSSFPAAVSSSDGLVADGINEVIEELAIIEGAIEEILKKFPKKLENVAALIEESDNSAASQFK